MTASREMLSDELVEAMENLHQYPRLIAERAAREGAATERARILDWAKCSDLGLSTSTHRLVRAAPEGVACVCAQYDESDHGVEAAELWRDHLTAAARAAVIAAVEGRRHD